MKKWPNKDTDEVLDYNIDWTDRLGVDTISTSTWDVPAGITTTTNSHTTVVTTIWLSGGTTGTKYTFTNHIVTAGGRSMDQSVSLTIKDK